MLICIIRMNALGESLCRRETVAFLPFRTGGSESRHLTTTFAGKTKSKQAKRTTSEITRQKAVYIGTKERMELPKDKSFHVNKGCLEELMGFIPLEKQEELDKFLAGGLDTNNKGKGKADGKKDEYTAGQINTERDKSRVSSSGEPSRKTLKTQANVDIRSSPRHPRRMTIPRVTRAWMGVHMGKLIN
ncbi:omega-hydroxypalmitate o-feruloyl transferase [Phtheirospermum japonicum]|uniref:Omega-hydroxypalmitate o-feruloyl transferase n=1 Tax=Phtheirospermum japonicum TaxID=374723 RepID=A0A830CW09_9LAMI|nr:omega-hydroxypalmitate o-feruloyl transferase [Phtheirospermum japonicum]